MTLARIIHEIRFVFERGGEGEAVYPHTANLIVCFQQTISRPRVCETNALSLTKLTHKYGLAFGEEIHKKTKKH